MKKIIYIFLLNAISVHSVIAATNYPSVDCGDLPWCDTGMTTAGKNSTYNIIGELIATMIEYVAVIAVVAIMIGWIMYLVSNGDEEKTKKAKSVIIWAIVWVIVSILAWSAISIINNFSI